MKKPDQSAAITETSQWPACHAAFEACRMATAREGLYSNYGIERNYASGSYLDDLAHAAVWLYKATHAYEYLRDAHLYWARSHVADSNPSSIIVW